MADAKIRIQLDKRDVHRGLAEIRDDFRKTAAAGGGIGAGGGGGGGGGFGGGGLIGLATKLAAASPLLGLAGGFGASAAGPTLGGFKEVGSALGTGIGATLEKAIFGDIATTAAGGKSALEQVIGAGALSVGYGTDPNAFSGLFDVIKERETRRAEGAVTLKQKFGGELAEDVWERGVDRISTLLEQILSYVESWF